MTKRALVLLFALAWLAAASPAAAHSLWLNLYESDKHPPGHAIVSIAWGHMIPMDDLVGGLKLESYSLVGPDSTTTALALPAASQKPSPKKTAQGMAIQGGDLGVNKISLTKESKPGAYQVGLVSKDNYYTFYLDQKGKKRWAPKSMDQLKEAKKILGAMFYKAYAKAYFKVKQWSPPQPLGHDLEITPKGDLSQVRAGEKVDFKITFMGKPLNTRPDRGIEYITATSNTFGGPDGFALSCVIFNGKAGFRFPTAGQWVLNVYHRQEVTPDNELKHLAAKCRTVMRACTLSLNVKP